MIDWFGQSLDELPAGFEILNLTASEQPSFKVLAWRLGYKTIKVGAAKTPTNRVAIGLEVERTDKSSAVPYWAFTSPNLIAVIEPQLANPLTAHQIFTINVTAKGALKRYSVSVNP